MVGRVVEVFVSSTVMRIASLSPGRTGCSQRSWSTPEEPMLAASSR